MQHALAQHSASRPRLPGPALEPLAVAVLAVHGALVIGATDADHRALLWAVVASTAALAAVGLRFRTSAAIAARGGAVIVGAVIGLIAGGPAGGFFLLWLFVAAAAYPLTLSGRASAVAAVLPAAGFLFAISVADVNDGPWQIALPRLLALLCVGALCHVAAGRYQRALDEHADAVATLDTYFATIPVGLALHDRQLRFVRVNEALADMNGLPVEAHLGHRLSELLPGLPAAQTTDMLRRVLRSGEPVLGVRVRGETPADPGRTRHWEASYYPVRSGSRLLGIGAVVADVTHRLAAEEQLAWAASHDALTKLPNRRLFEDRLTGALARAQRGGQVTALLLDLDRFKAVNDTFGHHAGDELLGEVAARLKAAVRPGDTVARFGGDEFAVLCETVSTAEHARVLAQRLLDAVSRDPIMVRGRPVSVTPSIGAVLAGATSHSAEDVMRDADTAMYVAKDAGRARFTVFDAEMRADAQRELHDEQELREWVARAEVGVAYQPIVTLAGERAMLAVEALARWQRADGTSVPPARFIALAEQTQQISELSEQVLRAACRTAAGWTGPRPPAVSVNLSAVQLGDPQLPEAVTQALAASGLPPSRLWLEITETALLRDAAGSHRTIASMRDIGVRIALDDFGSGYSSLAYLRAFAPDVVKIDRAFVADVDRNPQDRAVIAAIVDLARAFGALTVAEGIERPEQLAAVSELGCDAAQGYLLGRPGEDPVLLSQPEGASDRVRAR